jgi:hypothetical protein
MSMHKEIRRCLALFEKNGDALVELVPLCCEEFEAARSMLGCDADDPMYDCYPLAGEALRAFLSILRREVRDDCEYFIESDLVTST